MISIHFITINVQRALYDLPQQARQLWIPKNYQIPFRKSICYQVRIFIWFNSYLITAYRVVNSNDILSML